MTTPEELGTTTAIPVAAPTFAVLVSAPPSGQRPVLDFIYAQRVPVVGWRVARETTTHPNIYRADPPPAEFEFDSAEPVLIGHMASVKATIFIELPEGLYDLWRGEYYPDIDAAREWVLRLAQADWDRKHKVCDAA